MNRSTIFSGFTSYYLRALLLLLCLQQAFPAFAGVADSRVSRSLESLAPPSWNINPDDYEFNMNLIIRVNFQNVPSNNPGNVVGVFVGNQLRGVATPVVVGGNTYYYLTAYSNQYFGETLHFKVYYAPDDAVYPTMESVQFVHNSTIGSTGSPFWLNIDPNADYPPILDPILADTTLVGIPFDVVDLHDYTVSLDGDPVTWSAQPGPNLVATIVNGIMTVTPVSGVWIGTDSVRIIVTETTPNQLKDTITAWFTVLPDYGPPVWQTIPDQTIFIGQQFSSFDLDNYLTFTGPCHKFDYDVFPFTGSASDPGWPVVVPGSSPMTVIARPLFADIQLAGAGTKLAGFVNGNLAGWASPTGSSPNVSYTLTLKNVGAGNITFQLYDATNQYLYTDSSSLVYVAGGSVGTIANPYKIQLSPLVPSLNANGVFSIAIVDPTWTGSYPIDFIVWDCDYPNIRRDTTSAIFSIVSDTRPNITSASSVNFEENACSILYDTQTSDPNNGEGSGLTYSLAGGADAGRFAINATNGILSWIMGFSPDFENPQDADANNKYLVNIRVTNASNLSDTVALTVTITNQATEPFTALINGGTNLLCVTGSVNLQATGGISYVWSTGATTSAITVNTAGTYTVTATSTGACTATASIVVAAPPTITAAGNGAAVCIGSLIVLSSTPSGGTPPYASFSWAGPNGYSSTMEDPTPFPATANSGGTYTVTVTDASGCTATATKVITVSGNSAPTITATSNTPVCVGANIVLNSTPAGGSGGGYTYQWNGPNNFISAIKDPAPFVATAAAGGTYNVTLTDGAGCTGVGSTAVVVNAQPTITAGSNSPVSVGSQILLTSTPSGGSGSGYTFVWTGPNGFSSTLEDPTGFIATLPASGVYKVTLTDSKGCTGTASTTVNVVTCPTITTAFGGPVCVDGTVILQSTPAGGALPYASFSWAGPNGYSANVEDPAPFPTAGSNGTYTVTVTDQLGCTATATIVVTVHSLPSITATNTSPVCEGFSVTLSSTPSAGSGIYDAFLWTGPDGYVATIEDPAAFSTTLASAGVYTVKVTDSNGCTGTSTTNVTVNPKPIITASSNSPVCLGSILQLQSTTTSGTNPFTFSWTGPLGYTSTAEDPSRSPVVLTFAGIYKVTVTDNAGCTGTSSTAVTVTNFAGPSITAASNSPVCSGSNVVLTSTPTGGALPYTAFAWAGPNNYSATQEDPPGFIGYPNASGAYTVTVTDNHNCQATASVSVVVNGPAVNVTSNSPICPGTNIILSAGAFISGATYSWTGPGGFSSTLKDPTPFVGVTGTYSVTVTAAGCSNIGSTMVIVEDVVPPMITCPANTTISANATCTSLLGTYTPATLSDNCNPNPTVTQSPAASTVLTGHNDFRLVTLTANDGNGNTASCTFTVTLKDVTPPTITCPANTTIAADANCSGVVGAYSPVTLTDNCASNLMATQSPVASTPLNGHNDVETVTLTASDGNGNTASCTFTVTLKDVTPPTITCPANVTIAADANCAGVVGAYSPVTVSDNCNANPSVTQSPAPSTVLMGHNDAKTVTLTANDGNGNTASCNFTVTLKDVTKPTITCPANLTIAADANCAGVVGAHSPVAVADNCNPNPTVTQSPAPSTVLSGHNDFEVVTLTADDGNGNTQFCTFTVTLKDVTPPSIICPVNMTVAADGNCSGVVGAHSPVSVSDNCTPNPTVTQSPAPSTVLMGHNDFEVVTLTANDGNGNTASCTFTVTLKDVTPPTITCPANVTIAADANCAGVVGAYSPVTVSDNCNANPSVTQSPAPSTVLMGHNDAKTVTLTANDGNGNTASCNFTVTLKDVTKPTITCPANLTIAADANCAGVVGAHSPVAVADNCNPNPTVTQSPAPSTVLSGHNDFEVVTLTADDGNGNTQFCTFTVTLKDVTQPSITCPANMTVAADANCSGVVGSHSPVSVSDNCNPNPTVTQSPAPSTVLMGHNDVKTVTLTANDGNGNTASCTFTVTLKDVTPPTITCPPNVTIAADANCSGVVGSYSPVSVADNCNPNPTVTQSPAPSTVLMGHNDSKTVTLTANDGNGNTASCTLTVTLKDVTKPTITCPANTTLSADANCSHLLGSYAPIAVADNCNPNPTVTQNPPATTVLMGHNDFRLVTLTANDGNGNTQSCTFTVTLKDITPPTVVCKAFTAALNAQGTVTITPADVYQSGADNCGTVNLVSVVPNTFTCANLGPNTVVLTVNDGNGNTATCSAVVTVVDLIPPTMLCKNATVWLNSAGQGSITAAQINNGSTDNCTLSTITVTPSTFNCSNLGANTVTLKGTDQSGNMGTCTAIVAVTDTIKPTMFCKNATLNLNALGEATLVPADVNNNSFDNCAITQLTLSQTLFTCANLGPNTVTLTGKDASNNMASCMATVTIQDLILPMAKCKNAVVNLGPLGKVAVVPADINNGSSDNCSFTMTVSPVNFTCANIGNNTVTLKVTDGSGNMATCNAVVNIKDATPPTALCKNITIFLNSLGKATITVNDVDNGSTDNCGIVSRTIVRNQFDCGDIAAPVGDKLTITDGSGNVSSCIAQITVKDNLVPTAVCTNTTVALVNGTANVQCAPLVANSFDNCSVTSVNPISKTYTAPGTYNLPITVKDWSGNGATCTSVITVLPGAPVARPEQPDPGTTNYTAFKVAISPNPSDGIVLLDFELPEAQEFGVTAFNLSGLPVFQQKGTGNKGRNSISVQLSHLASGIYILEVRSEQLRARKRLMLQR